ncbi:cyanobactin biosynthesis system PatB/AcyB/McaB family protein [Nonomuraea sp. FMUSA5-5]|uniref:Cyanobactin biosynthesis system PatB/AcyB/McaB family protein n=1 Tax=Nonomuraea composti TaxID=2720023 RepID=A0ABX1B4W9_9ACTN|nr:cyanobactin biosynthesis system PatB/AcyB/McaB family protein [Nonomuraea sp. FMUSA5-5]NJP92880.1 cyanobactin biosynthesis system PatB/AcyB/McaB family protein [Nonomuraea sp. FMUSA5-5]
MSRPPQVPPVRRDEPIDPYATVDLSAATPQERARLRAHLLFAANTGDPAAFNPYSHEQAKLSAA